MLLHCIWCSSIYSKHIQGADIQKEEVRCFLVPLSLSVLYNSWWAFEVYRYGNNTNPSVSMTIHISVIPIYLDRNIIIVKLLNIGYFYSIAS